MKTDSLTLADGALEDITLKSDVKGTENPKTGLIGLSGNADHYLSVLEGATWLDISLLDDEDEFASKIVFLAHFDEVATATTFSDATGFTFGRSIGAAHTVDGVDAEFGRRMNLTAAGLLHD